MLKRTADSTITVPVPDHYQWSCRLCIPFDTYNLFYRDNLEQARQHPCAKTLKQPYPPSDY
jgi:hypothetical protein